MTAGSSPLHILDPTGFEVDLQKSIVDDSAYLPRFVVVFDYKVYATAKGIYTALLTEPV